MDSICAKFAPSEYSALCSARFQPACFERKLPLGPEAANKTPRNLLKRGSVPTVDTVKPATGNERSSTDDRSTGHRWPLSTNPAGQIRKYCDCGVLVSVVPILFHSIRVLSEDIGVVLRCVAVLCLCSSTVQFTRHRYIYAPGD